VPPEFFFQIPQSLGITMLQIPEWLPKPIRFRQPESLEDHGNGIEFIVTSETSEKK